MYTATPQYGTPVTLAHTLAALASTAGLLAGRQSAVADNTADLADDALVGGQIGTTATTTTNTQIQIWLFGSYDGTLFSAGMGAGDANVTPDTGNKNNMRLLQVIPNITTTALTYTWGPFSVAQAFGGIMPSKWGVYIVQNTGTALASGATKYTPVKFVSQ